jgi:hypothetical protein
MAKKTQSTIYIVGGGKGGVGKTMCSLALTDWLLNDQQHENVVAIETDDSNPDFYKSLQSVSEIKKEVINLDEESGWVRLMNMMPEFAKTGAQVVINTAARATPHLEKFMNDMQNGCNELNIQLNLMWSINRQRDSLLLLNKVLNASPTTKTTVVKNLYFGAAEKFVIFEASSIRNKVNEIDLPDLNDFVSDKIYSERLPLSAAAELQFGERISLQRFRKDCSVQFAKIASTVDKK